MVVGGQRGLSHLGEELRESGIPRVFVRSTSMLRKSPIRSSSAWSVSPAIALPIGMSVPAPSRDSNAANPACSTMNRLVPERWARPVNP